ncbi:hypothetical protein CAPTEDRAFT_190646 [Capitella teleta]|uniref:FAD/NAD(P)-binding domain-containing protein n=1 Tax=Capitella teleta TaxID=283909 RepID=R7T6B7_CAPTE|nr:hypothetical protein CAPTEDRAFT_190646 [Capitella teleta]|eukprot:ELT88833.1 hypothetical protein CAPTEDRAFT_190646 [Capitella teleta]
MGNPAAKIDLNYEYIIVGAGPAGVQAAYYLGKAGRDYMIIEKGDKPGYFFEKFPRHRTLISINKRFNYFPEDDYNMRHDWNSLLSDDTEMRFTKYSDELFPPADRLVDYMHDFCERFDIKISYNTTVEKISRKIDDSGETEFQIKTQQGTYKSQVLIMATGAMKEKLPDIPGIEFAKQYSEHSIKQSDYENKKISIIGGGNSAFETADHLAGHAAIVHMHADNGFKMAWDTHFPGDLRAINNSIIDMFHLKSIHGLRRAIPTKLEEIIVDGKRKVKMHFDQEQPNWDPPSTAHMYDTYDDVIFCTGWYYIIDAMWDDSCKPEITTCGKFPCQKATWESTNINNLFFAGTSTQGRDRRAASSFIHGFRYSAKCLALMLNHLRHGDFLPQENFSSINMEKIAKFVAERMSTTSALYQLNYGVLCDVMILNPEENVTNKRYEDVKDIKGSAKYFYELPTEWALEQPCFKNQENMWVIILKDGKSNFPAYHNPLDFVTPPRMLDFDLPCQAFIQPIIRRYRFGELISETSIGSNFVVRLDQHQLTEDAHPTRSLNKMKKLMCDQFGVNHDSIEDLVYTEEQKRERMTPWDQSQIDSYKMREQSKFNAKPCSLIGAEPPKWQRVGKDQNIELMPEH